MWKISGRFGAEAHSERNEEVYCSQHLKCLNAGLSELEHDLKIKPQASNPSFPKLGNDLKKNVRLL